MPIYRELKATKRSYHRIDCGKKYCAKPSGAFPVPVANRVYFRATARDAFLAAAKAEEPKDRPRYSDLNFFLLQQVVERVTGQPIDEYVREQFYEPLGLQLTFRPLERYGRRETLLRTAPTSGVGSGSAATSTTRPPRYRAGSRATPGCSGARAT